MLETRLDSDENLTKIKRMASSLLERAGRYIERAGEEVIWSTQGLRSRQTERYFRQLTFVGLVIHFLRRLPLFQSQGETDDGQTNERADAETVQQIAHP